MAAPELKLYEFEIRGIKHTGQLSKEDADRYGAKEIQETPKNKAATRGAASK